MFYIMIKMAMQLLATFLFLAFLYLILNFGLLFLAVAFIKPA